MTEYISKSRFFIDKLLEQPGFNDKTPLGQVQKELQDNAKAKTIDRQIDMPFYNSLNITFIKLMCDALPILASLSPKALKVCMQMIVNLNQSNVMIISKRDLVEMVGVAKKTLNDGLKEMQENYIVIIQEGDSGDGQPSTYIFNPMVFAMSKATMQIAQQMNFWELAGGEEAKRRFDDKQTRLKLEFANKFEVREEKDQNSRNPLNVKISKRGKQTPQQKNNKKGDAASTATKQTRQAAQSPKKSITRKQSKKQYSKTDFENDPEIPFNDVNMQNSTETEQLAGQMSVEDYPEIMPEGEQ